MNNFSDIWFGLILLGLVLIFLMRKDPNLEKGLVLVGMSAVLLIGWFGVRPDGASAKVRADFESGLGQGDFVLLEL